MSSILLDFSTIGCIINIWPQIGFTTIILSFLSFFNKKQHFLLIYVYSSMIGCLPRFKIVQHDRNPIGITHGTLFMLMGCGLTLCCDTALWYFVLSKAAEYMNLLCRETFVFAVGVQVVSLKQFFNIMIAPNICFVLWLIFSKTWKIWKIWYIIILHLYMYSHWLSTNLSCWNIYFCVLIDFHVLDVADMQIF